MKKFAFIILILLVLGLTVAAASYNKAYVWNKSRINIVTNDKALIGVTTEQAIQLVMSGDGTTSQAVGSVRITNRSNNDAVIQQISCTAAGYTPNFNYISQLPSGNSVLAEITLGTLPAVDSLPFEVKVKWTDGEAVIPFKVAVDQP